MSTLREKIARLLWERDNPQDKNAIKIRFEEYPKSLEFIREYYAKADLVLAAIREAVEGAKPKRILKQEGISMYNIGIKDYHEAVKEVLV